MSAVRITLEKIQSEPQTSRVIIEHPGLAEDFANNSEMEKHLENLMSTALTAMEVMEGKREFT